MALNLPEPGDVMHLGEPTGVLREQPEHVTAVDELLLARAKAGNEAALETLFRRFEAPVYTLARRLTRTPHDAEDVLQETFLEVVRSIGRFRGEGSFAGWIRKVAASKALMRLRQQARAWPRRNSRASWLMPWPQTGTTASHRSPPRPRGSTSRPPSRASRTPPARSSGSTTWRGTATTRSRRWSGKTASFSKSQLARAHARLREMLAPPLEGPCT